MSNYVKLLLFLVCASALGRRDSRCDSVGTLQDVLNPTHPLVTKNKTKNHSNGFQTPMQD